MITDDSSLTARQVQHIRDLHRLGFSPVSIAVAFNVSEETVQNILRKRTWTSLRDLSTELPLLTLQSAMSLRLYRPQFTQSTFVRKYARRLAERLHVPVETWLTTWTRYGRQNDVDSAERGTTCGVRGSKG